MVALLIGIAAILFALAAVLPFGLGWWQDVLLFIRGALPVTAFFIGLIAVFIGIADIKDRMEARKEEEAESGSAGKDAK